MLIFPWIDVLFINQLAVVSQKSEGYHKSHPSVWWLRSFVSRLLMIPDSPSIAYLLCAVFACNFHFFSAFYGVSYHWFPFFHWYSLHLYWMSSICVTINFQKPTLEWVSNNVGKTFLYRFKSELGYSLQVASGQYPPPIFLLTCP